VKVPLFQHSSGAKTGLRGRILGLLAGAACALGGFALAVSPAPAADSPEGNAFFESRIRPLLIEHCYECHSTERKKLKGGLALDTREGIQKGGESGLLLEPGNPDASRLIEAVRYQNRDFQMPPKNPLPAHAVRDLEQWVRMGAPDPRATAPPAARALSAMSVEEGRSFWAFRRPVRPAVPPAGVTPDGVTAGDHPVDRFLAPGLQKAGFLARPAAIPRARAAESEQKAISTIHGHSHACNYILLRDRKRISSSRGHCAGHSCVGGSLGERSLQKASDFLAAPPPPFIEERPVLLPARKLPA
jgi:hypothetical protein